LNRRPSRFANQIASFPRSSWDVFRASCPFSTIFFAVGFSRIRLATGFFMSISAGFFVSASAIPASLLPLDAAPAAVASPAVRSARAAEAMT
jgi:hypothetical protein